MENTYHLSQVPGYIPRILKAFPMTVEILSLSLLFSLVIGTLVAAGALSSHRILGRISKGYISFMRGIPTLVLIFLLYLGLPQVMAALGVDLSGVSKTSYIIASLSLSTSANMAEMMRAAYLAVEKGQREAAYSVGMKGSSAFLSRCWETISFSCSRRLRWPLRWESLIFLERRGRSVQPATGATGWRYT